MSAISGFKKILDFVGNATDTLQTVDGLPLGTVIQTGNAPRKVLDTLGSYGRKVGISDTFPSADYGSKYQADTLDRFINDTLYVATEGGIEVPRKKIVTRPQDIEVYSGRWSKPAMDNMRGTGLMLLPGTTKSTAKYLQRVGELQDTTTPNPMMYLANGDDRALFYASGVTDRQSIMPQLRFEDDASKAYLMSAVQEILEDTNLDPLQKMQLVNIDSNGRLSGIISTDGNGLRINPGLLSNAFTNASDKGGYKFDKFNQMAREAKLLNRASEATQGQYQWYKNVGSGHQVGVGRKALVGPDNVVYNTKYVDGKGYVPTTEMKFVDNAGEEQVVSLRPGQVNGGNIGAMRGVNNVSLGAYEPTKTYFPVGSSNQRVLTPTSNLRTVIETDEGPVSVRQNEMANTIGNRTIDSYPQQEAELQRQSNESWVARELQDGEFPKEVGYRQEPYPSFVNAFLSNQRVQFQPQQVAKRDLEKARPAISKAVTDFIRYNVPSLTEDTFNLQGIGDMEQRLTDKRLKKVAVRRDKLQQRLDGLDPADENFAVKQRSLVNAMRSADTQVDALRSGEGYLGMSAIPQSQIDKRQSIVIPYGSGLELRSKLSTNAEGKTYRQLVGIDDKGKPVDINISVEDGQMFMKVNGEANPIPLGEDIVSAMEQSFASKPGALASLINLTAPITESGDTVQRLIPMKLKRSARDNTMVMKSEPTSLAAALNYGEMAIPNKFLGVGGRDYVEKAIPGSDIARAYQMGFSGDMDNNYIVIPKLSRAEKDALYGADASWDDVYADFMLDSDGNINNGLVLGFDITDRNNQRAFETVQRVYQKNTGMPLQTRIFEDPDSNLRVAYVGDTAPYKVRNFVTDDTWKNRELESVLNDKKFKYYANAMLGAKPRQWGEEDGIQRFMESNIQNVDEVMAEVNRESPIDSGYVRGDNDLEIATDIEEYFNPSSGFSVGYDDNKGPYNVGLPFNQKSYNYANALTYMANNPNDDIALPELLIVAGPERSQQIFDQVDTWVADASINGKLDNLDENGIINYTNQVLIDVLKANLNDDELSAVGNLSKVIKDIRNQTGSTTIPADTVNYIERFIQENQLSDAVPWSPNVQGTQFENGLMAPWTEEGAAFLGALKGKSEFEAAQELIPLSRAALPDLMKGLPRSQALAELDARLKANTTPGLIERVKPKYKGDVNPDAPIAEPFANKLNEVTFTGDGLFYDDKTGQPMNYVMVEQDNLGDGLQYTPSPGQENKVDLLFKVNQKLKQQEQAIKDSYLGVETPEKVRLRQVAMRGMENLKPLRASLEKELQYNAVVADPWDTFPLESNKANAKLVTATRTPGQEMAMRGAYAAHAEDALAYEPMAVQPEAVEGTRTVSLINSVPLPQERLDSLMAVNNKPRTVLASNYDGPLTLEDNFARQVGVPPQQQLPTGTSTIVPVVDEFGAVRYMSDNPDVMLPSTFNPITNATFNEVQNGMGYYTNPDGTVVPLGVTATDYSGDGISQQYVTTPDYRALWTEPSFNMSVSELPQINTQPIGSLSEQLTALEKTKKYSGDYAKTQRRKADQLYQTVVNDYPNEPDVNWPGYSLFKEVDSQLKAMEATLPTTTPRLEELRGQLMDIDRKIDINKRFLNTEGGRYRGEINLQTLIPEREAITNAIAQEVASITPPEVNELRGQRNALMQNFYDEVLTERANSNYDLIGNRNADRSMRYSYQPIPEELNEQAIQERKTLVRDKDGNLIPYVKSGPQLDPYEIAQTIDGYNNLLLQVKEGSFDRDAVKQIIAVSEYPPELQQRIFNAIDNEPYLDADTKELVERAILDQSMTLEELIFPNQRQPRTALGALVGTPVQQRNVISRTGRTTLIPVEEPVDVVTPVAQDLYGKYYANANEINAPTVDATAVRPEDTVETPSGTNSTASKEPPGQPDVPLDEVTTQEYARYFGMTPAELLLATGGTVGGLMLLQNYIQQQQQKQLMQQYYAQQMYGGAMPVVAMR